MVPHSDSDALDSSTTPKFYDASKMAPKNSDHANCDSDSEESLIDSPAAVSHLPAEESRNLPLSNHRRAPTRRVYGVPTSDNAHESDSEDDDVPLARPDKLTPTNFPIGDLDGSAIFGDSDDEYVETEEPLMNHEGARKKLSRSRPRRFPKTRSHSNTPSSRFPIRRGLGAITESQGQAPATRRRASRRSSMPGNLQVKKYETLPVKTRDMMLDNTEVFSKMLEQYQNDDYADGYSSSESSWDLDCEDLLEGVQIPPKPKAEGKRPRRLSALF